ncbi:MAG TPA: transketolase C-terminal domain-containing protein [Ktedonobacteraceae bacterium]|jgi:transketolase|nr:transketolase C-terminal domain-containing protein [Ktedonobacteraceae bacterium]
MTITMRQQMGLTIEELFEQDERLALVLAEISTDFFRRLLREHPQRALNLGILEQTMISVAAGMAMEGFIPVVHSITPFLVERPYEQIKDDFCYQRLGGNFISTGGSYDYSTEGMTHHGPADVPILRNLPGMQIVVPGTPREFDRLFRAAYANGAPTYFRLSVTSNPVEYPVTFGKLEVVKRGTQATVIAVGPALARVLPAVADLDVMVLYCTTVAPFDAGTLRAVSESDNIVLVEPYYEGALVADVCAAMQHRRVRIETIGVPRVVLSHYGEPEQHDEAIGFTPRGIRQRIERFLYS